MECMISMVVSLLAASTTPIALFTLYPDHCKSYVREGMTQALPPYPLAIPSLLLKNTHTHTKTSSLQATALL